MTQQAGWYPDPWGQAAQRWWDGQQWTSHVSGPTAPGAVAPPAAPTTGAGAPQGPWTAGPAGPQGPGGTSTGPWAGAGGVAGAVVGPPARVSPPANPLVKVLALGGAALAAIGSFLTWATLDLSFGEVSKSGMDGDGVLTLPGAVVFGGLAASSLFSTWSKGRMIGALVVAALVTLIAVVDVIDISSRYSDLSDQGLDAGVSVGVGLWAVLAGGLIGVAGCVMALAAPKDARLY